MLAPLMTAVRRRAVLAAALLAGFAATAPAALAADVTLRIHHFFPPTSPVHVHYFSKWKERVEQQSGGRIEVQIYPSMQLGGTPPSLYDQARDGVADIIWTVVGYTPDRFPEAEVFDLPFLPTTAEATSQAAYEYYTKHLTDDFGDVHVIAVHTHSPGLLHTRNTPVRTLADMRGLKFRTPSRVIGQFLTELGARPVGMPVPQTPEALSRGVIDGTVLPFEGIGALRLQELLRNHIRFAGAPALYSTMMLVVMNKAKMEGLPEDLRKVVAANSGIAESREIGRVMDAADAPIITEVTSSKTNAIIVVDEAETARWKEVGERVTKSWVEKMNAKGFDGQKLVDDARGLVAKYGAR